MKLKQLLDYCNEIESYRKEKLKESVRAKYHFLKSIC